METNPLLGLRRQTRLVFALATDFESAFLSESGMPKNQVAQKLKRDFVAFDLDHPVCRSGDGQPEISISVGLEYICWCLHFHFHHLRTERCRSGLPSLRGILCDGVLGNLCSRFDAQHLETVVKDGEVRRAADERHVTVDDVERQT